LLIEDKGVIVRLLPYFFYFYEMNLLNKLTFKSRMLTGVMISMSCLFYAQEKTLFSLLPANETGINFNNKIKDDKEKNILKYSNFYGGAGVGVGDFNNDGLIDVYFAGNIEDDVLYLNKGNFKFEDISKKAGIASNDGWSTGVTVADVNNDGLLDIYVSKELYDDKPDLRKNKLYMNQGNAKFIEQAEKFGVANSQRTRHATFFDYDKDGYLDLFILNQPPNPGSYSSFSGKKLLLDKYTSRLYKNINGTSFIDVTEKAGLLKAGFPNAVSASDFNNDGWTDLYVANDFYAPDAIYINNKNGTFTNIVDTALNHMSYYSMGVDVADINNDGFLDVFVLDMVADDNFRLKSNMSGMNPDAFWKIVDDGGHYQYMFNNLHVNNGNNTFSEIAQLAGVAATDWSWANLIADFDNDGKKDIYITNGLLKDIRNTDASKEVGKYVTKTANEWVKNNPDGGEITIWDILDLEDALGMLPSQRLSNFMYKNTGKYQYEKTTKEWGLDTPSFSNGAAYADFDNDGDLDIIVNNINDPAFVYKNNATNNFVRLRLKSKDDKPVIGARVTAYLNNKKQLIELSNVRGVYSTSEHIVHFGIADASMIDSISIHWPNSKKSVLKNINANKELVVFMENDFQTSKEVNIKTKPLFTDVTSSEILPFRHKENSFDDYKHQVLLPHKLSQFGPSLVAGDVNGDGLEDVFVGGAVGYSGSLFLQDKKGNFRLKQLTVFEEDKQSEDVDALFFDLDSDGDIDLYVVSGGNEYPKSSIHYRDRVYINDGKGDFIKSDRLKLKNTISGSVVKAADFDADGDLDLFIGGRLSPRDYPTPTDSRILENDNGVLKDITKKAAKELLNLGMVTDAIWTDYDQDNDLDLMLVGEWMPITVFENINNVFHKNEISDFSETKGWWFSIDQGDFDKDGDMDYMVGNLGLNYKYKTSHEAPFDVYYKDFDGNGAKDIVLGYYNYGEHFPVRGFSCSSQQVPSLKQEVKKYDLFAAMDIKEIYGSKKLDKALYYDTDIFTSVFIENEGNSNFSIKELPIEAQFSSLNDMIIDDFNKDTFLDVLLVGNLFVSEIETSRNDAGIGVLLLGDGKNNFEYIPHQQSGVFNSCDAKKIIQLKYGDKKMLFIGNNDDSLRLFIEN